MMRIFFNTSLLIFIALTACSPVKLPVTNQYKLEAFSHQQLVKDYRKKSILITMPEAAAGYQTEQMFYMKKPYELIAFAQNTWINPPASMLLPLMVQSLEYSHYFHVVSSGLYTEQTDYQIDSQLIDLKQNFSKKPSVIDLVVNVVLSRTADNRVLASQLFKFQVQCPMDNPYGGVIAANHATELFTAALSKYVIKYIEH